MGGLSTAAHRTRTRTFSLMLSSLVFCTTMRVHVVTAAATATATAPNNHIIETDDDTRQQQQAHINGDNEALFLEELGISSTPNIAKMNISQEEYIEKMSLYLSMLSSSRTSLESSHHPQEIPQLLTYNSENKSWRRRREESIRFHFHVERLPEAEVKSAELRLLFPAQHAPHRNATHFRLYQLLSPRRRRLLAKKTVHLSHAASKWADFDATKALQDWTDGARNLGLQLECDDCKIEMLRPTRSALNALVQKSSPERRTKRSYFDTGRSTDCANVNAFHKDKKPKCCRHEMQVSFEKLHMEQIIQPKQYEAGFCRGRCPLNFNHATNHSRIQNLVHKLDKRSTPRACCAPSRLEPLEILMVDPNDPSKLTVERWDNMIVLECACS